ncbi:cytochrome bd-I ubiquinol oxidase subunit 2 apoprotein [Tistlia consotensis]|uniref:Cytochrome bd-I ubiquinol oxidase subunit 2 apoprotein n=1 Tax=Tistlia consotensis USBA 355 TaxID=560819 RepID=A0A1Y6BZK4_9PROT|nr:cytochrome d ubiquinol oxidase subunit II [Tistlia consotensis]SMF33567.1 cytochrome bd-I ubiquinol oxidase subunit 2 apoprotein [Tistlia consotensis USBA 355]SNR69846.1 cytochrome bd-I ubiquinol oxidase subunit 2 apoprotein [Tistlia consotensis]
MDLDTILPVLWALVIVFGVVVYVLADGFDLGIGILYPFAGDEAERDRMMNSVAPVWDGNETWLVLGGAGLLAAFPLVYSVVLPAFYLPLVAMLLALVFRGVAFEFRFRSTTRKHLWSAAFFLGSLVAGFCQGIVLGGFVRGVPVEDGVFGGGSFDWLEPFPLFVGLALVAGYGLLGAGWTILKTEGALQARARRWSALLLPVVLLAMAAVSLWMPITDEAVALRWFSWPNIAFLWPVPVAVLAVALLHALALARRSEWLPHLSAAGLFLLGFFGLGISLWPYAIPREVDIWAAAAPPETQGFALIGFVVLMPLILGYGVWSYWVFRGKVRDEGYH